MNNCKVTLYVIAISVGVLFPAIYTNAEQITTKSRTDMIEDSLNIVLDTMQRNEEYFQTLATLQLMFMYDPRFLHYTELKEREALKHNQMQHVCASYSDRAIYYRNKEDIDSFYYWKKKMDPLALELKEFNYYFYLGNTEVSLLIRKGKVEQAIQTAKKLYETAKEYENEDGLTAANMSMGTAMMAADRHDEAKTSFETALALLLKNNGRQSWLLNCYSHLILICDNTGNYAQGLEYANQKQQIIENYQNGEGRKKVNDGYMYNEWCDVILKKTYFTLKLKNPEKAWQLLEKVRLLLPTISEDMQKQYHHACSNYYNHIGNYQKALSELNLVYDFYIQSPSNKLILMKEKANLLAQTGSFQESINIYKDLIALQDSTNKEWQNSQLSELRTIYDTDHLKLVNSELELKNKHSQMQMILIILVISIIALIFISFLYVRIFGIKKKLELSEAQLLRDKEALKIAKEKAEEARDLAQKAERKESFFANMSHEIRTPLNAIVGFSNLLVSDEELSDEERILFIKTINQNCDQLLKLVNDVLDLSRMESGKMSFSFSNYDLTEIMEEVYSTHKMMIPKQLQFIESLPAQSITVHVDKMRLKQVLFNFINNAIKFTPEGHIRIGYELNREEKEITLFVEDTGRGIPEEHQKKIFERFYKQVDTDQGTGLGLSICTVIAEKQGGRLTLVSEVGKGSCFSIILPFDETIQ